MSKTLKQIADELGIDKQKIYRFVQRNHITEVPHDVDEVLHRNGVKYYDETTENLIKQAFFENVTEKEVHHEVHHDVLQNTSEVHHDAPESQQGGLDATLITMLQSELQAKNNEIRHLHDRLAETTAALAAANAALQAAHQSLQAEQALHAGVIQALSAPATDAAENSDTIHADPVEPRVEKRRFFDFFRRK